MSASREKKTRQAPADQEPTSREQKRQQEAAKAKRSNILYAVVGIICVVMIAFLLVWNTGLIQRNVTAATVNGQKYSAADVQYYFNTARQSILNYYVQFLGTLPFDYTSSTKNQVYNSETGETWYDYLMDQALDNMAAHAAILDKAEEEGYTMSQESQEYLEEQLQQVETAWVGTSYSSRDAYLRANYGPYITYDRFVELYTRSVLTSDYISHITDGFTYTDQDYEAYYQENADSLDSFTLSRFAFLASVNTTDEDGNTIEMTDEEKAQALEQAKAEQKALAEELQAKLEAGQSPADLAEEYADQLSGDPTVSQASLGSSLSSTSYAEWLMDEARQPGDVTVVESEAGSTSCYYYVVLFEGRELDKSPTDTVRHILVAAEQDEGATEPTQEQYDAAQAKAQELLDQWKAGEATEDSFAQLAKENSADPGSAADGGLITDIHAGSGYVSTFTDWAMDEARQPGDTGIVQNTGSTVKGWHIMYYVGATGTPVWQLTADSALRTQDYTAWEEAAMEGYEVSTSSLGMKFIQE